MKPSTRNAVLCVKLERLNSGVDVVTVTTMNYDSPGSGIGTLMIGAIVIVVGLGTFFPQIPWNEFWAALLVLLGGWIIGFFGF